VFEFHERFLQRSIDLKPIAPALCSPMSPRVSIPFRFGQTAEARSADHAGRPKGFGARTAA
jgi:hypothetical protein